MIRCVALSHSGFKVQYLSLGLFSYILLAASGVMVKNGVTPPLSP